MLIYAECVLAADWARGGPAEADLPDIAEAEALKSTASFLTHTFPVWVEHVSVDIAPTEQNTMNVIFVEPGSENFLKLCGFCEDDLVYGYPTCCEPSSHRLTMMVTRPRAITCWNRTLGLCPASSSKFFGHMTNNDRLGEPIRARCKVRLDTGHFLFLLFFICQRLVRCCPFESALCLFPTPFDRIFITFSFVPIFICCAWNGSSMSNLRSNNMSTADYAFCHSYFSCYHCDF